VRLVERAGRGWERLVVIHAGVGVSGVTRDVGIAVSVDGDAIADVGVTAAEVGRIG